MKKILTLLCALLLAAFVFAADDKTSKKLAPTPTASTAAAREITWDDLLPKNWDPLAAVKGLKLDELQDTDPRAVKAMEKLRAAWDKAPANPDMAGQTVRIPGFMVPLEYGKEKLTEFLLVPYFGACIHVPPPPANQIIHIQPAKPVPMKTFMDAVWVEGVLELTPTQTDMGNSGYRIKAARVTPYKPQDK
jgi:hypothetical protein